MSVREQRNNKKDELCLDVAYFIVKIFKRCYCYLDDKILLSSKNKNSISSTQFPDDNARIGLKNISSKSKTFGFTATNYKSINYRSKHNKMSYMQEKQHASFLPK